MKLTFLGANRQVTGSRYYLEAGGARLMIDCGLFQEREFLDRNWAPCPVPPAQIDAVLLTHVHIDHSGLIPRLVQQGFGGPIYCTSPTSALARIMLPDAARIQEEDAAYKQRRHRKEGRPGKHPEVPLYTEEDARRVFPLLKTVAYSKPIRVAPDCSVTFLEAGHILGSAMLQMDVQENGAPRRILFSGDIGQWDKPLIRDPSLIDHADQVVMESTYGDRNHESSGPVDWQLSEIIKDTVARGGNLIIPTFAVERAQELMYHISDLVHNDRIPDIPVFVDSPMAADVTEIFQQFPDCFDQETWDRIRADSPPLHFPGLRFARTVQESKNINDFRHPCIIMSTSGMCNGGRIKHHLRRNLDRSECTILFVGFQAHGTLGRRILDGDSEVRIHGRPHRVRAQIRQISGLSAHADQQALLRWLGHFQSPPRQVFLTHGEESAAEALATLIRERLGCDVRIPHYRQTFQLQ
jgi:metallo-beta-lactamase family protein